MSSPDFRTMRAVALFFHTAKKCALRRSGSKKIMSTRSWRFLFPFSAAACGETCGECGKLPRFRRNPPSGGCGRAVESGESGLPFPRARRRYVAGESPVKKAGVWRKSWHFCQFSGFVGGVARTSGKFFVKNAQTARRYDFPPAGNTACDNSREHEEELCREK